MCCRYAATPNPKPQEIKQTPMGTPIANTEFVISANYRSSDYAKNASHRRIEYALAMFQLPRCASAEQNHF